MTRGRRPRESHHPKCRNIMYYFSQPAKSAPPPAKKARVGLSQALPPSISSLDSIPPSLPSPSPSPISPSPFPSFPPPTPSHNPPLPPLNNPTSHSVIPPSLGPPTPVSRPSSPVFPPALLPVPPPLSLSHLNVMDDLENLLLLRSIPFHQENGAEKVRLFTRNQTCLADSFLSQIDHMGLTRVRLNRLLDYMHMSLSATRMPSADIMYRLWHMTSDLKVVVQTLDTGTMMRVSSLFHTMLSLHPPGGSHTAFVQYHQFIQRLGSDRERGVFGAWLHIKQLLSTPGYKHFHHYISFLVDLLLSDFWSHLTSAQTGNPLFVSIFWPNSTTTNSMSLPIRQLLEIIHHLLDNYSGTEVELLVLQSSMSLLFLVTTRCPDVQTELFIIGRKLSDDGFLLLISLLHPLMLHAPLLAFRHVHPTHVRQVPRPTPTQALDSPNGKLPNIDELKITTRSSSPSPVKPPTDSLLHHTPFTTTAPAPTTLTLTSQPAHLVAKTLHNTTGPTPLKRQNCKPLHLNKSPVKYRRAHSRSDTSVATKRGVSCWHTPAKRVKLSNLCENCDAGAAVCYRCQV